MQKMTVEISWETILRIIVAITIVAVFVMASNVIIILLLSLVIATALDGSVTFLEKRRIPRALGTLLIFVVLLMLLAVMLYIIVPLAVLELRQLLQSLSAFSVPLIDSVQAQYIFERLEQELGGFIGAIFSGGTSLLGAVSYLFGNIFAVVVTTMLSFYFTISRSGVERFIRAVLPADKEESTLEIYGRVKRKMSMWFRGQLFVMFAIFMLTYIGLTILGVPYALVLSIITGLFGIVPIVGSILAGVLVFLVAITDSLMLGVYVAVFFVLIQQFEAYVLVPLIMRHSVNLSPAIVIIALLVGNRLAGISGMILALPVTMALQEWMAEFEKDKKARFARTKAEKLIE